jgi:hypothetical protein
MDRRNHRHYHQGVTSPANNSFAQRSWLHRAVWVGTSLTIISFIAAASSASMRLTARLVHRRALETYKFVFGYNSQHVNISDSISLFTLCLSPRIAHLVAGVPEPGALHQQRMKCSLIFQPDMLSYPLSLHPPHWGDPVCHFDPTSILWRYFVILDRRLRCLNWSVSDVAASTAHFWIGNDQDSSEERISLT